MIVESGMDWLYIVVAVLLGTWFVLSAINQFDFPTVRRYRSFDRYHLLPMWTFFAPNPGVHDYHLVARTADGAWEEVDIVDDRRWWNFLWNPSKRTNKVVSDIVMTMSIPMGEKTSESHWKLVSESFPLQVGYLLLLSRVEASVKARASGSASFQFALLRTHGFGENRSREPLILSRWHSLAGVSE